VLFELLRVEKMSGAGHLLDLARAADDANAFLEQACLLGPGLGDFPCRSIGLGIAGLGLVRQGDRRQGQEADESQGRPDRPALPHPRRELRCEWIALQDGLVDCLLSSAHRGLSSSWAAA
jgi:hypothetical protein